MQNKNGKNEFLKVCIKSRMCYYFPDVFKLDDFDLGNILRDKIKRKYFDL